MKLNPHVSMLGIILLATTIALSGAKSAAQSTKPLPENSTQSSDRGVGTLEQGIQNGVAVRVTSRPMSNGTVKYSYTVTNNGSDPIVSVSIGYNYYVGDSLLDIYPVGWSINRGIKKGSIFSPNGWKASVLTTEESPYIQIQWTGDTKHLLRKGQSLSGFSIVVPTSSPAYQEGYWTAVSKKSLVSSAKILPAT